MFVFAVAGPGGAEAELVALLKREGDRRFLILVSQDQIEGTERRRIFG